MKVIISTDSACDMPNEMFEKYNIKVFQYVLTLGDKEVKDKEISYTELFDYVKQTGNIPKTASPSTEIFKEYFEGLLKDCDYVIHFNISGDMTSGTANAIKASEGLNVKVIDSRNLSSGIALLVLKAAKLLEQGKSVEEIVSEVEKVKDKVQSSFLIDTLQFLHKGGRCSSLAMLGAKLLMLKPKIEVIDGKMTVGKKYMGSINGCLKKYVEDCLAKSNPDKSIVFCTHSGKMDISSSICDRLKEFGFKEVYDCVASSTISAHCGPNTLGILYINQD